MEKAVEGEQVDIDLSAQDLGEQAQQSPSPGSVAEQVTDDLSPEELLENSLGGAFDHLESEASPQAQAKSKQSQAPQEPEHQQQEWETAPTNWPKADREAFNTLPEEQKKFVHGTVTSAHRAAQEKMDYAADLRRTVGQFVDNLQPNQNTQPQQTQAPKPQQEQDLPPEDPIDRIKWETKKEIREDLRAEKEKERGIAIKTDIQNTITKIGQDPLYNQVRGIIDARVQGESSVVDPYDNQGRTYQQVMYDRLNLDPTYFQQTYLASREVVLKARNVNQQRHGQQPTMKTTRTPTLEKAGATSPPKAVAPQVARKKEVMNNIRRGKITPGTLTDYLNSVVDDASFA